EFVADPSAQLLATMPVGVFDLPLRLVPILVPSNMDSIESRAQSHEGELLVVQPAQYRLQPSRGLALGEIGRQGLNPVRQSRAAGRLDRIGRLLDLRPSCGLGVEDSTSL